MRFRLGRVSDHQGTWLRAAIDAEAASHQTGVRPLRRGFFSRAGLESCESMGTYPPPGPGSVGQRIDAAIELIEMELRHAVAYVNAAIVPQVRIESISALRTISDTLGKLADKLDQKGPRSG